ncbi:unnamed protein product [Macrosiphum euphorbiae]|uniref:DUF4806 domain-containing protein n=1 Tax=Macrosiphum euphorbiae TaxID=13131 RepID=A0AAV0XPN6_9HEMI|nr:unnamed protein product [Macrosiphum euphorbiae]
MNSTTDNLNDFSNMGLQIPIACNSSSLVSFDNFSNVDSSKVSDSNNIISNNLNDNYSVDENPLKQKLQQWISDYHVSHNCVNSLLSILRSEGLKLPKDARTLLKTPKAHEHSIISIHPGSYIHLGVEFMLTKILTANLGFIEQNTLIQLGFNIDGFPLTSSSKSSFWPILLSFVNIPQLFSIVIPVGIYHGKYKKPSSSHEFLQYFTSEMKMILTNGICIKNKLITFEISQVVCDAPAKSFILNVKGHNAYHGCNSCIVEGTYIDNKRMAYLDLNAPLRSNQSFRDKQDSFYHKDSSPLEEFPIDITSTVVLEYMHNICLGVMKKLIVFWVKGNKSVRLVDPNTVSEELINLKCHLPSEFNRLPRSLEECEHWKATEFRTFLFYTGPIVLKGRLKKPLFKHFMLLNYAIRLLICSENCHTHNSLAKDMLKRFVREYGSYYGEGYVGYNVHGLIHVADFVLKHGHLDLFSAFKYENYLQFLKKSCKNDRFPLQDAYNRIIEKMNVQIKTIPLAYPILKRELKCNYNLNNSLTETLYEQVTLEKFVISSKSVRDKYFMLQNNDIVEVTKIVKYFNGEIKIEAIKFNYSPMFDYPSTSDLTKIFYINEIIPKVQPIIINLKSLKHKCFVTPIDTCKYIAMALLHSS